MSHINEDTIIRNITCKACDTVLPDMTVSCHLNKNHPEHMEKHKCKCSEKEDDSIELAEHTLIQYILDELKIFKIKLGNNICGFKQYSLQLDDIYEIDGISVNVFINILITDNKKDIVLLVINNSVVFDYGADEYYNMFRQNLSPSILKKDTDEPELTFTDVALAFDNLKNYMSDIYHNKLTSRFANKSEDKLGMSLALSSIIKSNKKINITEHKCCVCYDKTDTVSQCKHYLCLECWENIDDDDESNKPCPLCRETLCIKLH